MGTFDLMQAIREWNLQPPALAAGHSNTCTRKAISVQLTLTGRQPTKVYRERSRRKVRAELFTYKVKIVVPAEARVYLSRMDINLIAGINEEVSARFNENGEAEISFYLYTEGKTRYSIVLSAR